jgi:biotin synthase-related radical SAM superfamily protein
MTTLRLSLGSAIALGLKGGSLPHPPTTAYIMVGESCASGCLFCTQGKGADPGSDKLSRVTWPRFDEDTVFEAMESASEKGFGRICLQVLVDPIAFKKLPRLIGRLKAVSGLPISLSITPIPTSFMKELMDAGADRIGIALDGASEVVFERTKGGSVGNPYTYSNHKKALEEALSVFGRGQVSTHIIVGLGETDRDIFETMLWCSDRGILLSLFAYTYVKSTMRLQDPPELGRYRALQVLRHLIFDRNARGEIARFDDRGKITSIDWSMVGEAGNMFQTRGCPDCNRPYYTESPKGPIYNYPYDYDEEIGVRSISEAKGYVGN